MFNFRSFGLGSVICVVSLLGSQVSWSKPSACFPVPFDHFWFRVDKATYKKMGESSYFRDESFSYFEPNKSPWGQHYGHYITGNLHHLEIFDEAMPTRPEPLGIAFISEKAGCLAEIHAKLTKLGRPFEMQPDADWGRYTEAQKNKSLAVWVAEMKPAYVGAPDGAVDRAAWIHRMRKMNGDTFEGEHNFQKIKEVVWRMDVSDIQFLEKVLTALGWGKKAPHTFALDGTQVVLERSSNVSVVHGMKSLTLELLRPYRSVEIENFRAIATSSPADVTFTLK